MSEEFGVFTNWQQAKQQEKMAKYQANIADMNKRATLERGVEDENRRLSQSKNIIGEIRGGQLENGITGQSAIDLLRDSMINVERDTQTMRASYLQEGENIQQESNMLRYQAKQYGQQARQVLTAYGIKKGGEITQFIAGGGGSGFAKGAGGKNMPIPPQGQGVPAKQWKLPR